MFRLSVTIFWICLCGPVLAIIMTAEDNNAAIHSQHGVAITIDKTPYMVALRFRQTYDQKCGGTLIAPQFVVTAAHCFDNEVKEMFAVIAGSTTLLEKNVRVYIQKLFRHPLYRRKSLTNDVAVLKLNRPLIISPNLQPIGLCDQTLDETAMLQVSGWGRNKDGVKEGPAPLLGTIRIPVVSQKTCVKSYRGYRKITDAMVCAAGPLGQDACQGDSGGPAIYGGRLCAIVSFGNGCGRTEFPGVYTRIEAVRDFIEDCLKK